jgi:hypothetical protein
MSLDNSNESPFAEELPSGLMKELDQVLNFDQRLDKMVLQRHFGFGATPTSSANANFSKARDHLYLNSQQIRATCVAYRLRFLRSNLYSGLIPFEVIWAIKDKEFRLFPKNLEFYILASDSFFIHKKTKSNPLLFLRKENGTYQLVCQWGHKRTVYEKLANFPFRDFKSLVVSAFLFGLLCSVLAGMLGLANGETFFKSILFKVPIFVLCAGAFSTGALIYGLLTRTEFSSDNWNKMYFKASSKEF